MLTRRKHEQRWLTISIGRWLMISIGCLFFKHTYGRAHYHGFSVSW
jgi:hypothetical protein